MSELYLLRHGTAFRKSENPERPLTDEGRAAVERVAQAALRLGLQPRKILHSGKLRAQQTAEILAEAYGAPEWLEAEPELLDPNAEPSSTVAALHERELLVGHLPHLQRLVAHLLTGDPERKTVKLAAGALVRLARYGGDEWTLAELIVPDALA